MSSKGVLSLKRSVLKKGKIPSIVQIPRSILTKKLLRKNNQHASDLLSLPTEILMCIIKRRELDIFDIACLMLTCKELASIVDVFNIGLTLKNGLTSEIEYNVLAILDTELELGDFEDEDAECMHIARKNAMADKFKSRTDSDELERFMRRLDSGWNTSESRYCSGCCVFKSTQKIYWVQQILKYTYKSNTLPARGYRVMRDCLCKCDPDNYVYEWIKRGQDETKLRDDCCPDCRFAKTKENPTICDQCSEMDMSGDDIACGCSGCDCDTCGCYPIWFQT